MLHFYAATFRFIVLFAGFAWLLNAVAFAEEPPLPAGLDTQQSEPSLPPGLRSEPEEPALPSGLEDLEPSNEPALPKGLSEEPARPAEAEPETWNERLPFDLSGFGESRFGIRTQNDPHESNISIGEVRLHTKVEKYFSKASFHLTSDFLFDPVPNNYKIDLEKGNGWIDLREANLVFTPADFADVKVGRQILTWATGDLIFINDLFPKDFKAFFIGRDVDYLKAPSDALKVSLFHPVVNLNIVYTPRFDADRFIDGSRISYFDPLSGTIVGRNSVLRTQRPDRWFQDDEWSTRLYRNFGPFEAALYGYYGFWKNPAGNDPATGQAIFPQLSVYGASLRGPVYRGIGNIEFGYYDSRDDRNGDNPLVSNSQMRLLVGYEQELLPDLTLGAQYFLETMLDYGAYRETLPAGIIPVDEARHVLTLRLTWLTNNQNLKTSLFTFYSPSDQDAYLRPNIHYQIDDHWSSEIGANIFTGRHRNTFFGQFQENSNIYVAMRFGF
ncbi:MAG: hypothetical protein ACU843_16715 [Gammaproteobacteria bacterium]